MKRRVVVLLLLLCAIVANAAKYEAESGKLTSY